MRTIPQSLLINGTIAFVVAVSWLTGHYYAGVVWLGVLTFSMGMFCTLMALDMFARVYKVGRYDTEGGQ